MKFIKLIKKYMDQDDNVYDIGSILEVSDDVADELIKAVRAEAHNGVVKEVKAEDIKAEIADGIKKAVTEAMAEVKKADGLEVKSSIEVTEDAPLWKDSGDFLDAIVKASSGKVDERLYKAGTGQNENVNADGMYLVEHRIGSEIYAAAAQASVLLPKCETMEIGPNANGIKINQVNESARGATSLFSGVRIYSPAEAVAKTAFKQAYSQVDISLGKLCAVNYMTDELMADRVALRSFIKNNVGQAFAWTIDDDILHSTTNTAIAAIENHASTVQFTVAGANPIALELAGMYASMLPSSINRAEWYMSLGQYVAIMQIESTSGVKLIQPSYEVSAYGTLFGRPVNVIEQADVAANDTSIMFLDLSQYLIIKKGGIDESTSIHVKWLEDETAFRWTMRIGGAPKLASAITLPSGDVVAPFVTRN